MTDANHTDARRQFLARIAPTGLLPWQRFLLDAWAGGKLKSLPIPEPPRHLSRETLAEADRVLQWARKNGCAT